MGQAPSGGLQVAGTSASVVFTQVPVTQNPESGKPTAESLPGQWLASGARLVRIDGDGEARVLTGDFHSACDPSNSFDGKRILFAGKHGKADAWDIYEMTLDDLGIRRVTRGAGNCRQPRYQSKLYTIVSPEPWYQITFTSDAAGTANDDGTGRATHLYSCKLDGSNVRRLTFNLSSDFNPLQMNDGRILFASWERSRVLENPAGRVGLFAINLDGTDLVRFAESAGPRVKRMPCITDTGLVVFVESARVTRDGAGQLGTVTLRRPLKSYRPLSLDRRFLYHSPSPLPDGGVLVSRRPDKRTGSHGIYRLNPATGAMRPVFDAPDYHEVQAVMVRQRAEPDGRSSVVNEQDPSGKLYCLNVTVQDLADDDWLPPGTIAGVRVLEGVARQAESADAARSSEVSQGTNERRAVGFTGAHRRILGEIDIAADGSFNVQVPANMPIELQTLDKDGLALRSCGWIWARNREPRGCIGCHEDGERTPENRFVDALRGPSISLMLPVEKRRTVDFRRDVVPIIVAKCVPCHGVDGQAPDLNGAESAAGAVDGISKSARIYRSLTVLADSESSTGLPGKYIHPGRARTSPLIWHLLGRNTARPWDGPWQEGTAVPIPKGSVEPLTDSERRTFIEWIDLGALWNRLPDASNRQGS